MTGWKVQYQSAVDLKTEQHKKRQTTCLPIQYIKNFGHKWAVPFVGSTAEPRKIMLPDCVVSSILHTEPLPVKKLFFFSAKDKAK